jgi:putative DNA primase/helicase
MQNLEESVLVPFVESKTDLKSAAFEWWQKGFVVVPMVFIKEDDGDIRKQPLTEWKKWQSQEQTLQEFESLPWSEAEGFEVLCGKPNREGLCVGVVDFDIKKTSAEAQALGREALKHFKVTARERTVSGGEHFIFLSRKPVKTISAYHDSAALELLGESKLCVVCPSKGYLKLNDNLPTVLDDLETEFLSALKAVGVIKPERTIKHELHVRPCFAKLMQKAELSHDERVALVNELEHQGYSKQDVMEIFHENKSWETEYSREKTELQIESIYGKYGHFTRNELLDRGICLGEKCERFSWPDCRTSPVMAKYFVEGKFVPMLLAEELMNEYHFITMRDNEQMYVWREGCYRPYAETLIKEECKRRLGEEFRTNRVSEVIDYIKASTFTDRREEPPHLIPLKNGVLDINIMELKPHSPEYLFFNLLPVEYNPNAKCPNIEKFLNEVAGCKEDVDILLEVIGFCLYREYFIAKALMLVGEGSNGKSTFLNLVKAFLGKENVAGRSLQDLEENRFAKADLQHKLANIYADLPDKALWRTGTFKMLTGRDLIAAERKFQQSFTFENYAKLLFSANKVPEAYDDTDAFFRRWIIVVFPNQFVNDEADPHILKKLTTPEELSGLLNLVLPVLKRLLEKGQFSYSKTTEEIRQDYIRKSSPIGAFVMDCLAVDSDAFIPKQDLYNTFAEYCRIRKIPCVTKDTFFKNLPQYVAVIDHRPKINGQRIVTFKGIRYSEAVSTLSSVSRVFYTLIERKADFDNDFWDVEVSDGFLRVSFKIGKTLDRVDSLDTNVKTLPDNSLKTLPGEGLAEKLEQLKTWLLENKDANGIVDAEALAARIRQLGLDVSKAIKLLKDDCVISEAPHIGKWLVVKC